MPLVGFHRKEGVERQPHDFYATHPDVIPPLLDLLGWQNGGRVIWENSCGQGHLSKALEAAGHTVVSTDLIDRGYGIGGHDFLAPSWLDGLRYDAVVMNPPYKHAEAFVRKSLTVAPVVCAFLRLSFLESQTRADLFDSHPPVAVAVFRKRMRASKDATFKKGESSAVAYAWFIWRAGNTAPPMVVWL